MMKYVDAHFGRTIGVRIGVTDGGGGYISSHFNFIPKMKKYGLVTR